MRKNRDFLKNPSVVVHASNWGVNQGQIFFDIQDYHTFLHLLFNAQKSIPVSVLAYSLLRNQFDLILQQRAPYAISHFMQKVCQAYAEYINRRLKRSGHVFTRRYKGVPLPDAASLLRLSFDIHRSPEEAGLTPKAEQWRFSSCRSYLAEKAEDLADRTLIWNLAGGPRGYARLMGQFDPAGPASIKEFLCAEGLEHWRRSVKAQEEGEQISTSSSTGARSGPGPP